MVKVIFIIYDKISTAKMQLENANKSNIIKIGSCFPRTPCLKVFV